MDFEMVESGSCDCSSLEGVVGEECRLLVMPNYAVCVCNWQQR